ncbi:MAG: ATPase, T2SS/T4P/T4SS family [Leptospirales bacterium]
MAELSESTKRNLVSELVHAARDWFGAFSEEGTVEIMVNPDGQVFVDRLGGGMERLGTAGRDSTHRFIATAASLSGQAVTPQAPVLETELPGLEPFFGARFEGLVPPVVSGPAFALRKRASLVFSLADYEERGIFSPGPKEKEGFWYEGAKSPRDLLSRAVRARRNILVVGGTGCHAKGTKILMSDGTVKNVEEVQVGDRVMGPDSRPRTVLRLHRGIDRMVRIVPNKGESFVVNEKHCMALTSTPRKKGEVRKRLTMTVVEYVVQSKRFKHLHKLYRNGVDFKSTEEILPIDPYFLGVLLGDGGLKGSISVSKPDEEIRDEVFRQAVNYGVHVNTYFRTENNPSYRLCSSSRGINHKNRLIKDLEALRLHNVTGEGKFIPHIYKTGSKKQRLELLAGLLDTDGHLSGGGYDFITKSDRLAQDFVFLARSLGFAAYMKESVKTCQGNFSGIYFRVSLTGDCSQIPLRILRKKAPARLQKKSVLVTGFTVEPEGLGDYYGFELDGDHLYLTADFTVHHNSGKTTFCNALLLEIANESGRVVLIEDTRELQCPVQNRVELRTSESVDMQKLLRATLRLRPDRIVVGEVRDFSAYTLLKAWNTGHPGGTGTIHADSALSGLSRLEQLASEGGIGPAASRPVIAEAIHCLVFIRKTSSGRRVSEILAVDGLSAGEYRTIPLLESLWSVN